MEKLPIDLKIVKCIANEYTFWEQWQIKKEERYVKEGVDISERWKSQPPQNTLTIGKEYKVIKIDNRGCVVIKDDFGVRQRRSRIYFEILMKETKKAETLLNKIKKLWKKKSSIIKIMM